MTKWSKTIVRWKRDGTLYLSVPFTWQLGIARAAAQRHDGPVFAGGPAVSLMGCDGWAETAPSPPDGTDVLTLHNPEATFTTRGCVRACKFCAVPRIEGKFRELDDWTPRRVVCDNNFLAASKAHVRRAVRRLRGIEGVDFNQGLDARLFTDWHAEQLAKLKKPVIRFALDNTKLEGTVAGAVERARNHGLRDLHVYVLVGFDDTPEDALCRLETVRSWKMRPNPMRYQPLDTKRKNRHVSSAWTTDVLQDVMRYYSRLRWLDGVPFEDYREHEIKRRFVSKLRKGRKNDT